MFEFARLTTLHPALVHLPLGAIPLATIAYVMATLKRSERWLFVGDVALGFSGVAIAVAAAFGFVAYFRLDWPGGLGPWPLVHLVLGVVTTVSVWLLIAARWRNQRWLKQRAIESPRLSKPFASAGTAWNWALASVGISLLAAFTGYIGGEILVFHGGMAVKAGASGTLSPPLAAKERPPKTLNDAMQHLRALWASSVGTTSQATAERPKSSDFARVAQDARDIQRLSRWIVDWAHNPSASSTAKPNKPDLEMEQLAKALQDQAVRLEQAATQHKLGDTLDALGATSRACADCHEQKRWQQHPAPLARSQSTRLERPAERR